MYITIEKNTRVCYYIFFYTCTLDYQSNYNFMKLFRVRENNLIFIPTINIYEICFVGNTNYYKTVCLKN